MGAVLLCVLIAVVATQATGAVDGWAYQISSQVVAGGSSLLAGLGAWRHRMSLGWVGWLIFLGIATQGVAALWVWVHSFRSDESLFPGPVDALFLFNYVCMGAAALLVVRRRRLVRNTAAMIDAIAATVAFAVLAWCFVIADIADNASVSIAARAVGALYPICDVLVFGAMIRLLFSSSNSRGPVLFLTGGMLCLLAGDVGFTVAVFAATDNEADRWITALYHLSVMLVALSLWQKDTARLVDVQEQAQERLGTIRKLTLSVGALVAPATLVVLHLRGNNEHVLAAAAGGVILSALTLIRMSLLISAVESQSEQLVQLARTDGLTGLANRRTFDFELGRAMREVLDTADGEPPALSIGLLDLDRFKQFNDTHGHSRGTNCSGSAPRTGRMRSAGSRRPVHGPLRRRGVRGHLPR